MNGIERSSFVLQCKVQSVVLLRLGDVDGHASELHRPAFRIPGQYASAAKPSDRAVLPAKTEIKARCAHGVFIKNTGGYIIKKSIPVFRVNAPQKGFHFVREIILVAITHQPAEAVAPVHRCQRAVRCKVDNPASRLCQIGKKTDRCGLFFHDAAVLFVVDRVHKGLPPSSSAFLICCV